MPGLSDYEDPAGSSRESRVARAIRGEREAVRALWEQSQRWVAGVLSAYKPRDADLSDLLQDVALIFIRRIGDLRDEAAFKPWLRTTAINAARLAARSPSRRLIRFESAIAPRGPTDAPSPLEAAPSKGRGGPDGAALDEASRLMDLARELPDGYREPLMLKALKDMSYRQIGEVLGLPETTIETRIARGRRMLRELARRGEVVEEARPAGARASVRSE